MVVCFFRAAHRLYVGTKKEHCCHDLYKVSITLFIFLLFFCQTRCKTGSCVLFSLSDLVTNLWVQILNVLHAVYCQFSLLSSSLLSYELCIICLLISYFSCKSLKMSVLIWRGRHFCFYNAPKSLSFICTDEDNLLQTNTHICMSLLSHVVYLL